MIAKVTKSGIGRRVVASILVVGILPFLGGLYITYRDGTTTRKNSIGVSFQDMAKDTANNIDMVIRQEITDVKRFAISPTIGKAIKDKDYEKSELDKYIKQFIGFGETDFHSMVVADVNGDHIAPLIEAQKKDYSEEKWFKAAYNDGKGKVYVGDLKLDEESGLHLMSIAAPVMDNEIAIGVVMIRYMGKHLLEIIDNVRIENTGHANLADSSGTIIMCPIFPPRSHHIGHDLLDTITNTKPGWGVASDDAHGGVNSIIGYAPVETTLYREKDWFDGNSWHVFIRQSPDEVYAPIYSLLLHLSVFGIVLIVIISLAGVYAARKIVGPINQLFKGAELIGEGNLYYRLNIKTNDEIEKLADEFNSMAGKLEESYSNLENRKKELEASEERYKDLIENSPEMIHSINADRYFEGVNKTELDILGYTLEEMKQKRIEDIVPQESRRKIIDHFLKAARQGESSVETQFITKGDKEIDVSIIATALYHPISGNFVRTRAFVRDITDRKILERYLKEYNEILERKVNDRTRELEETKDYLENLFETANDVICRLNKKGIITYVNKKVEEWGYTKEDLLGKSFLTILSKRHKGERFEKTVLEGIKQSYEVEVVKKSGEMRYAIFSISLVKNDRGGIVEVLGIAKDITEQKKFEQQISHTEKMSAIDQLAAGIAHEINNPLGGILNCLYNLRKKRFSPEKEEDYYKSMEDGIHRVKKIVRQLLDFSKQHEPEFVLVDVNSLMEEVLSLMNYALSKKGITIEKSLSPDLPILMLDRHEMIQVLTNMLLNSVHAINGKGQINVRTSKENGWCNIDIEDSGDGIPQNVLPSIFIPFFTTKDVSEGTGLGLSVSKGIVEMHHGKINVRSEIGKGSVFTIKLPIRNIPSHHTERDAAIIREL